MEQAILGILIPFAGTSLGAAVYAMKQELDRQVQRGLTGFASGVMIAASVWSLLIPAMEEAAPLGKLPSCRLWPVLAGYLTAHGSGPAGSAPAYVQREGRRAAQPFTAYNHARPGRDAA